MEVTADTPGAIDAVRRAARGGAPVGAGTIGSATDVHAFGEAGAAFLVSPGVTPEVVRVAVELGIPAVPGALSPTEIATAQRAGATAVKLFPASLGGPSFRHPCLLCASNLLRHVPSLRHVPNLLRA